MVTTLTSWLSVALWLAVGAFRGQHETSDLPGRFTPGLADMGLSSSRLIALVGIRENSRTSIQGTSASLAKDRLAPGISRGEERDVFGVPFKLLGVSPMCFGALPAGAQALRVGGGHGDLWGSKPLWHSRCHVKVAKESRSSIGKS